MATRKKKVKAKSKSSKKAAPKKTLAKKTLAKKKVAAKKASAPKKKKAAPKPQPKEGDIVSTQQMAIAEIVGDIEERMALDRLTATVE